jgi:heptosyltransferase-3
MRPKIPLAQVKNILVIIFKYHGDVLLTSPLLSALKEALPLANIDVYLYKNTLSLLQGHPSIRDFFAYDQEWKNLSPWQRVKEEAAQLKAIRARNYDLTINLTRGDRGAIASKIARAPYRVGYETDKGMAGQKHLYTHLLKWTETRRHTVERNLDTLRILGIHPSASRDLVLSFSFTERAKAQELLEEKRLTPGEFILVHPVSRVSYKNWPSEKWAELIKHLLERGEKVVISGASQEAESLFVDTLLYDLGEERKKVVNLVGRTSLKELGVLIEASKLLLCLDSVPLHLASAVKAKTLTLFGPSCEKTWGPWQNPHATVLGMPLPCRGCDQEGCGNTWISDCMQELPVDLVLQAADELLNTPVPAS